MPTPATGADANPFGANRLFYANPQLAVAWRGLRDALHLDSSDSALEARLENLATVPSAFWIDTKDKIVGADQPGTLEAILASAAALADQNDGVAPLCTFVWYNLPNRDCHAKASSGEICCSGRLPDGRCDLSPQSGGCQEGLHEYMTEYADPFIEVLTRYVATVPVAIVLEPDSLANLITNAADPQCGAATYEAYTKGIEYAVRRLSEAAPSVSLYLDAGHGGWLGWDDDTKKYMKLVCNLGKATASFHV